MTAGFGRPIMCEQEQEALVSLFFNPNECVFEGSEVTLNLEVSTNFHPKSQHGHHDTESQASCPRIPVKIIIQPTSDYPATIPQISIFCDHLKRELVGTVKQDAIDYCSNLLGEPMLVSLAIYLQETLEEKLKESCKHEADLQTSSDHLPNEIECTVCTTLLHIDHMRSKTKYCKTLQKWCSDLALVGRLIISKKLILVILQGDADTIKDFIVRLKTVSIDVDSRGHSCKERMMTVLCEEKTRISQINMFKEFKIEEFTDVSLVQKCFENAGLETLYEQHVVNLQ